MFPTVVIVKAVWGLIVLLDIWEILSNDYDPKDPDRQQMPFLFLLTDVISLLFTAVVGAGASKTLRLAINKGATSSTTKGFLKSVIDKLPYLSSSLKYVQNIITKMFGNSAGTIINKVFGGLDTIITKLIDWIKNTFKLGKAAVKATSKQVVSGKGTRKLALGAGIGVGLAQFMKDNSLSKGMKGELVKQAQEGLLITKESYPQLVFSGPVNGVFDEKMEKAVKQLQEYLKLPVNGIIDPKLGMVLNVNFGPGNLEKLVGVKRFNSLGEKMIAANDWLNKTFGSAKGSIK
jgi:hypothetical protein